MDTDQAEGLWQLQFRRRGAAGWSKSLMRPATFAEVDTERKRRDLVQMTAREFEYRVVKVEG